jgi:DNA repair photolyase
VWLSPILPFINDTKENLAGILEYCAEAHVHGIINFGMGVTLREGDREYFYAALDKQFPGMRQKYHRKYGYTYELMSERNEELMEYFRETCGKYGIVCDNKECFRFLEELPERYEQMRLF